MPNKINFEEGIEQLESIVSRLESGDISLDESLKEYEQGAKLIKQLKSILSEGEAKIITLTNEYGLNIQEDTNDEDA